ncbi:asparagine synthase (glutamine-hydrolyzing) [Leptospira vanthielii]|uniref:asparagine synthase (glutamine-hydrolyzing) n=1 Tax=Leptospira vanthielii serovar Holland str. Waz Holland = ATCC 700522 TaxID=1218591 RepID=N1W843_9LEPT|nr:asparagine synthase (glutamine-hydrolyzing) [Leptospira vanthielii]EMY69402.1 asparagine synthase (glutamine-hydrolyzing) [Leptospira vanthielii serovar Holland str. Waz Holland = ATCC 700522]
MCGILGIAGVNPLQNRSWFINARDKMFHRGPDDAGEWWSHDGRVGLAHRRLSIIDLSPLGHQPMRLEDRGLSIIFNGEIYNYADLRNDLIKLGYTFRSNSDTEVLLWAYMAWGEECLVRLNGMFAFAIYDEQSQKLFLARDRAGEKPLFYRLANSSLQFASELKALLANPANPRQIQTEALDCYLGMGFVPGDMCILNGYNKLPPAHAMRFDLRNAQSKVWQYWKLPELDTVQEHFSEGLLLEELESLLEDSVSKQLIADVPVGILLSGGVDSSLVTAMAVRKSPKVKTFTIRFPGYGSYDETEHARLIANHFQTEHIELTAEESTADLLPLLAKQFDEPIIDSSMIPSYLVSKLIREHCTVALGGDGGDELFGGYGHHSRLIWLKKRLGLLPRNLVRQPIAKFAENLLPLGFKGRNWLQGLGTDFEHGLPQIAFYFDRNARQRLVRSDFSMPLVSEKIRQNRVPNSNDILQRATRMDFQNFLPEDILVKVDRASMLYSLEVRAPLLDYRLIEFAFQKVPSSFKANEYGEKKILLKKLCAKVLPPQFDKKRKQGFSIPLGSWLQKGNWKDSIHDILLSGNDSFFDKKYVQSLLDGQMKGRANSERIFGLALFELWRREYGVS